MSTCTDDVRAPVPSIIRPTSIVFTPDKNRTWAQSFGLSPMAGHTKGRDVAKTIVQECFNLGIRDVVFWAMSESNVFKRSISEREYLVKLLKDDLRSRENENDKIGFRVCGDWKKIIADPELEDLIERAHERTAKYQKQRLTVLFGYRGITDFKRAASKVTEEMGPEAIENEDMIRKHMWVEHLPCPIDMMVRTGVTAKNRHNSDSLLPLHGEHAYVYEVEQYWPDFSVELLYEGFRNFAECKRPKGE